MIRPTARNALLFVASLASIALAACGGSSGSSDSSGTAVLTKNAALPTTTVSGRATTTTMNRPVPTTVAPMVMMTSTTATTAPPTTSTSTTATTAPPTVAKSCTATGPCKVGQTGPAGGLVFYVASAPQKWGQYMEVRTEAFEQIKYDTCNLSAYDTYAAGNIGDGITQTAAVIAACAKDGKPAAAGSYARVNAYTQNGYGRWFIPSKAELQALLDSKVVNFPTDKDLTSGTWFSKPQDSGSRGFAVLYGIKKEALAGTGIYSRGTRTIEVMSDGSQSYGNSNNRWGWIYIARAFGPKSK